MSKEINDENDRDKIVCKEVVNKNNHDLLIATSGNIVIPKKVILEL